MILRLRGARYVYAFALDILSDRRLDVLLFVGTVAEWAIGRLLAVAQEVDTRLWDHESHGS